MAAARQTQPAAEPGRSADQPLSHELGKRLRFIEGQARGVQRMLANDRDLIDILTQVQAIQAAAAAAANLILQERAVGRIKAALRQMLDDCAGSCSTCDQLEQALAGLEALDFAPLLDELVKTRRIGTVRPAAPHASKGGDRPA